MIYTEAASLINFSRVFYRTRGPKIRLKLIKKVLHWISSSTKIIFQRFAYLDLALTFRLFLFSLLVLFFLHLALIMNVK